MKVLLAHPGTQYAFRLASALYNQGSLHLFVASLVLTNNSIVRRLLGSRLDRRVLHDVDESKLKSFPSLLVLEFFLRKMGKLDEDVYYERNLRFQRKVIKKYIKEADIVIGFDTSSWELASYCIRHNKKFVLDVSIGHPLSKEKVFQDVRTKYPNWKDVALPKSDYLISLEQQEFSLATAVVVPSNFVKKTLIENGVNPEKIFVNPFGNNVDSKLVNRTMKKNKKLNFLFFGSLTARKGLPFLLEAWRLLNDSRAILIVAGYGEIPAEEIVPSNVKILGEVRADERAELYAQADIFVFPSFFEGFAQVLVEAAGSGLPIISTSNSGAEEIVKHAYNGFIIDAGDVDQLISRLRFCIDNPYEVEKMSERIREKMDYFSWSSYEERWGEILNLIQ